MSDSIESLQRKIEGATQLSSVVRTMKALAASSIGQYERSVISLQDYYRTIELGIGACLRQQDFSFSVPVYQKKQEIIHVIVFGSDMGLVGQFNELLSDYVLKKLSSFNGEKKIWTVGERIQLRLSDEGFNSEKTYPVPNSVNAITSLITQILVDNENSGKGKDFSFYIIHNHPTSGTLYEPISQQLLPLDKNWQQRFRNAAWPSSKIPEVIGDLNLMLKSLLHEYLFVSLFEACSESLASENASRMAAMQRAEKNIGDLLLDLTQSYHRERQNGIDEELFDVVSGFEAMQKKK
jgi:F-type H+-transporting ATPase subunit gamma